jgi:methionine-S-sulfoxide reductase
MMHALDILVGTQRAQAIDQFAQGVQAVCFTLSSFIVGLLRRGVEGMTKFRRVLIWIHADAEALQVTFDPAQVTYRQLIEFFYKMHDPTTIDRQGPDSGSQYRSGIFYYDEEQKNIAEEVTKLANEKWWKGKIVTQILSAGEWWDAEDYHQRYLDHTPGMFSDIQLALLHPRSMLTSPGGYECPSHYLRKFPPLE